ncbi:MAG: hypothetical protein CM1200mP39_27990 [Dehalococcoidia bacterium]|nr:MAG: hypothetical protein CM1200mP39_27990 [Dehalococcoidia bacterium]
MISAAKQGVGVLVSSRFPITKLLKIVCRTQEENAQASNHSHPNIYSNPESIPHQLLSAHRQLIRIQILCLQNHSTLGSIIVSYLKHLNLLSSRILCISVPTRSLASWGVIGISWPDSALVEGVNSVLKFISSPHPRLQRLPVHRPKLLILSPSGPCYIFSNNTFNINPVSFLMTIDLRARSGVSSNKAPFFSTASIARYH